MKTTMMVALAFGATVVACNVPLQEAANPSNQNGVELAPPAEDPKAIEERQRAEAEAKALASEQKKEEEAADQAADEAKAAKKKQLADEAAAKELHDKALQDEAPTVQTVTQICAKDLPSCKKSCDKGGNGDAFFCYGYGLVVLNANPPKFAETRAAYGRACSAGMVTACDGLLDIDVMEKNLAKEIDLLWTDLYRSADEVAVKRAQLAFAKALPPSKANLKGIANLESHIGIIVSTEFCPAAKRFRATAGVAEYSKRAKDHCKDSPPVDMNTGASLSSGCTAAFATSCP